MLAWAQLRPRHPVSVRNGVWSGSGAAPPVVAAVQELLDKGRFGCLGQLVRVVAWTWGAALGFLSVGRGYGGSALITCCVLGPLERTVEISKRSTTPTPSKDCKKCKLKSACSEVLELTYKPEPVHPQQVAHCKKKYCYLRCSVALRPKGITGVIQACKSGQRDKSKA